MSGVLSKNGPRPSCDNLAQVIHVMIGLVVVMMAMMVLMLVMAMIAWLVMQLGQKSVL